jgi:hypothetical protein
LDSGAPNQIEVEADLERRDVLHGCCSTSIPFWSSPAPVDVVRNWRAQVEPVCKFITFLGDLGASAFLHQPSTTSISTHTCHYSSLDSIAAVGFGLGDARATCHKGNGVAECRGV